MEQEHFFQCPHCWEEISMILDSSIRAQTYIEDCEVCCNPIEISPNFEDAELIGFHSTSIDQ
jgi:transcription elongation factor Elf1|tara:strand:- start:795 stop:980 length:186 start_codon:yes stop_codon:yes gene_type:complete